MTGVAKTFGFSKTAPSPKLPFLRLIKYRSETMVYFSNEVALDCTAQSPDLNPIKHLWYQVKQTFIAYSTHPSNTQELKVRLSIQCYTIAQEGCFT